MSASRSRQKRKLEPISLEELAGATGMSGFCTFLTRDNSVPVPALDGLESGAPVSAAEQTSAVVQAAPELNPLESHALDSEYGLETSAPVASAPVETARLETATELSAGEEDAPACGAPDYRFRRRPRIREAHTVRDGHSLAEQAVYEAMYGAGKPYRGESRILTIGLRTLAELSRMAYSNCKANVRSLVAKRAVDELPGFSYTDGRTYIIHGQAEILRRRREAGLTHVLRTRGVAFVDPVSGAPDLSASDPTAPDSGAPPNLESSAPASILEGLRRHDGEADEAAAATLWRRCKEIEPAASADEVLHFIELKAGKSGNPLPLGFLLAAVPRCFEGESYRQFRRERRDRLFASEILRNPVADEEQREWARSELGHETA
jgi:hypothetical protein